MNTSSGPALTGQSVLSFVNAADVPEQAALVSVITPVVPVAGTIAFTSVFETIVNPAALMPLNCTAVMPDPDSKLFPVMVTTVPVVPDVGKNVVTAGHWAEEVVMPKMYIRMASIPKPNGLFFLCIVFILVMCKCGASYVILYYFSL